MKDNTNKWKDIHIHEILNIVKVSVLPKAIYKFGTVAIKIPKIFPAEIGKLFLKFIDSRETPK